jgi:hypothetical protein
MVYYLLDPNGWEVKIQFRIAECGLWNGRTDCDGDVCCNDPVDISLHIGTISSNLQYQASFCGVRNGPAYARLRAGKECRM